MIWSQATADAPEHPLDSDLHWVLPWQEVKEEAEELKAEVKEEDSVEMKEEVKDEDKSLGDVKWWAQTLVDAFVCTKLPGTRNMTWKSVFLVFWRW